MPPGADARGPQRYDAAVCAQPRLYMLHEDQPALSDFQLLILLMLHDMSNGIAVRKYMTAAAACGDDAHGNSGTQLAPSSL